MYVMGHREKEKKNKKNWSLGGAALGHKAPEKGKIGKVRGSQRRGNLISTSGLERKGIERRLKDT